MPVGAARRMGTTADMGGWTAGEVDARRLWAAQVSPHGSPVRGGYGQRMRRELPARTQAVEASNPHVLAQRASARGVDVGDRT